jgi:TM2 domain-containing membrane protein YozV
LPEDNPLIEDDGRPGERTTTGGLPFRPEEPGQGEAYRVIDRSHGDARPRNAAGFAWLGTGGGEEETQEGYTLGALKKEDSAETLFGEATVWDIPLRQGGRHVPVPPYDRKNPVRAALLSLVFPGLGQIYNGENFKGFLLFFWVLAGLIILIPGIIIWGYGIYDARAVALKMNSGVILYRKTDRSMVNLYFAMLAMIAILFIMAVVLS